MFKSSASSVLSSSRLTSAVGAFLCEMIGKAVEVAIRALRRMTKEGFMLDRGRGWMRGEGLKLRGEWRIGKLDRDRAQLIWRTVGNKLAVTVILYKHKESNRAQGSWMARCFRSPRTAVSAEA